MIADEVATGFGRTGRMFACEHADITPDLMCVAKGLTGGYLPLAATLATEDVFAAFLGPYEEFRSFFHGHTYTGNPLGCAVALASLAVFREERTLERLGPKIARLRERLAADVAPLPHVGDVRRLPSGQEMPGEGCPQLRGDAQLRIDGGRPRRRVRRSLGEAEGRIGIGHRRRPGAGAP